jgi:glycine/D-amino acid oxidase-like deaminating enzyme
VSAPDVAVIGGGIVGATAATFLAEGGARVALYERERIAGAASGRNSGVVQHPYDRHLVGLHRETLELYRDLEGLELPPAPAGVLLLAPAAEALRPTVAVLARDCPELRPELVEPAGLEPALTPDVGACRLETGYPVRPAAATTAFAERARRAGARLTEGAEAAPWTEGGRLRGVEVEGERRPAGAVLVAAGPWSPDVLGAPLPIAPVWGVNVEVALDAAPRHVLEEVGVEDVGGGSGPSSLFSLVTAAGASALGSTFLAEEPDPAALSGELMRRGQRFVPGLAAARVVSARACARPQSADGRPLVGPVLDGLQVAAGHGPWGISTGPATGRLAADVILGRAEPPAPLDARRFA